MSYQSGLEGGATLILLPEREVLGASRQLAEDLLHGLPLQRVLLGGVHAIVRGDVCDTGLPQIAQGLAAGTALAGAGVSPIGIPAGANSPFGSAVQSEYRRVVMSRSCPPT